MFEFIIYMIHLTGIHRLDYQTAMNIYYSSRPAERSYTGSYGIRYPDHKVPVEIPETTEPELIKA